MKQTSLFLTIAFFTVFLSCQSSKPEGDVPTVGFIEAFEDATVAQARVGFMDALAAAGYSETEGTLRVVHRNAQGDAGTLSQIVNYFGNRPTSLIGTSTTLATLAAAQRIHDTPIFQSVTAMPEIVGLVAEGSLPPPNLFGTGETLHYIDTAFAIITQEVKPKGAQLRVGMIYNQAEPQSVEAYERLTALADSLGAELVAQPLQSSAEAQLVVRSLLQRDIDAFFANPDNTVFAAFETIVRNCDERGVPIFTSESGLVARGAVAAFGADIYQWGYQSGEQAARYLETGSTADLSVEMLKVRKRVYNPDRATRFGLAFDDSFEVLAH